MYSYIFNLAEMFDYAREPCQDLFLLNDVLLKLMTSSFIIKLITYNYTIYT